MPQLVVVDHSIKGPGGHYYEYAMAVLRAARGRGLTPILVTNRRFEGPAPAGLDVRPAYTDELWGMPAPLPPLTALHALGSRLLGDARRYPTAAAGRTSAPASPDSVGRRLATVGYQVRKAVAMLGGRNESLAPWAVEWIKARRFASDTLRLFAALELGEEDVVFLPTLSHVELGGLLTALGRRPTLQRAAWHLLFRYDPLDGRAMDRSEADLRHGPLAAALAACAHHPAARCLSFYTDTEELSARLNHLSLAPFRMAPIPHTRLLEHVPRQARSPLRVVYLGDARREKGYHHLPRLIRELWTDWVAPGRVVFTVQSNVTPLGGQEAETLAARRELAELAADRVTLITAPLRSEAYWDLLATADVNLLPYEPERYRARSSGILTEGLAAGIPPIVPQGTWLARQIADAGFRHHARVQAAAERIGSFTLHVAGAHGRSAFPTRPEATHLLVTFALQDPEQLVRVDVGQRRAGGEVAVESHLVARGRSAIPCSILVRLDPTAAELSLTVAAVAGSVPATVQVDLLRAETAVPLGAVGRAYHRPEDIASALREVLQHYDHYLATARAFARSWFEEHNADRLLDTLLARRRPPAMRHEASLHAARADAGPQS